jgi:TusA-related sulfurtransferase
MPLTEDQTLDCRGLLCPMPVVRLGRQMKAMEPGQVLRLLATDRGACTDVPAWAADTGNELLESREENGVLVFLLRKGEPA